MAVDWDATRYHEVSDPQRAWGLTVLTRLAPARGERILDIGCGTGRLTSAIADHAPGAFVVGADRSWPMVAEARRHATSLPILQADALTLPFQPAFNAVFSTATFHWVQDHRRLFESIHAVLRPGGRLVAQAGGGPNLSRLYERAAHLASQTEFRDSFAGWKDPWYFATAEETAARLHEAGFSNVRAWLEPAPTSFARAADFEAFVSTVCLRHHLARLTDAHRERFVSGLSAAAAADDPPFVLDYWRLNIDAWKR